MGYMVGMVIMAALHALQEMTPDPLLEEIQMKTPVTKGEIKEEYQQPHHTAGGDEDQKDQQQGSWTDKVRGSSLVRHWRVIGASVIGAR